MDSKEPSSLGEELLIIQKEFDGFADTRERLDLLAIDKNGNLVIIEINWMTLEETSPGRQSNMPLIVPASPKEM